MIPRDEAAPKTILESFVEGLVDGRRFINTTSARGRLNEMVVEVFKNDFDSMQSWEEWHEYLSANEIILVRSVQHDYRNEGWYKWSRQKRLSVFFSPAEKEHEWMLVPDKTIEKMIIMGRLG